MEQAAAAAVVDEQNAPVHVEFVWIQSCLDDYWGDAGQVLEEVEGKTRQAFDAQDSCCTPSKQRADDAAAAVYLSLVLFRGTNKPAEHAQRRSCACLASSCLSQSRCGHC